MDDGKQRWHDAFDAYKALIHDTSCDSEYLRATGLVPNVLDLVGDVSDRRVLDAGCGTGWLFDVLRPHSGWECDIVPPGPRGNGIRSHCQDVRALTYDDESFDVVVSSLVLMWVDDLVTAFREAHRVTRPGGRLVVAITHPHFHAHGYALGNGDFVINRPLAPATSFDVLISGRVGPLTHYSRPLVDYYNAALAARWRLVAFRDHFIDMELYQAETADRITALPRSDKVPLFTFFVGQK